MEINEKDISYAYNKTGYMMTYKGKDIGGATSGNPSHSRRFPSNLKFFSEQAELTKRELVEGKGSKYMRDNIKKINKLEQIQPEDL